MNHRFFPLVTALLLFSSALPSRAQSEPSTEGSEGTPITEQIASPLEIKELNHRYISIDVKKIPEKGSILVADPITISLKKDILHFDIFSSVYSSDSFLMGDPRFHHKFHYSDEENFMNKSTIIIHNIDSTHQENDCFFPLTLGVDTLEFFETLVIEEGGFLTASKTRKIKVQVPITVIE